MRKKLTFISFCTGILLMAVYKMSEWILVQNDLAYRNTAKYIFISAIFCLALLFSALLIYSLLRIATYKQKKKYIRVVSGAGAILTTVIVFLVSIYVGIGTVFTHNPEHVVDKDGVKMVAYVDSFLQVEVRYYDYINAVVRGNQRKIYEDYGNGGYYPFERDVMPEARRSIYYDDDGNVIEQSES